jgi:hypothetical protein
VREHKRELGWSARATCVPQSYAPGVSTGAKCRWNAEVKSQLKADARCPS